MIPHMILKACTKFFEETKRTSPGESYKAHRIAALGYVLFWFVLLLLYVLLQKVMDLCLIKGFSKKKKTQPLHCKNVETNTHKAVSGSRTHWDCQETDVWIPVS